MSCRLYNCNMTFSWNSKGRTRFNIFTYLFLLLLSWVLATNSTKYVGEKKRQEISTAVSASVHLILATGLKTGRLWHWRLNVVTYRPYKRGHFYHQPLKENSIRTVKRFRGLSDFTVSSTHYTRFRLPKNGWATNQFACMFPNILILRFSKNFRRN